jgi:hypothetical protein
MNVVSLLTTTSSRWFFSRITTEISIIFLTQPVTEGRGGSSGSQRVVNSMNRIGGGGRAVALLY